MAKSTFVCIGCRVTAKRDHFWDRPPKWHNHKAWQRIAVVDIWWEDKPSGKGMHSAPYVSPKQKNDISQHMQKFRDDWMEQL